MLKKLLYVILFNIAVIAVGYADSKQALLVFQQNRYEPFRYTSWLKKQKIDYEAVMAFLLKSVPWILLVFVKTGNFLGIFVHALVIFAYAYYRYVQEKNKRYIKPLVLTARVKRQIATLVVLFVLFFTLLFCWIPQRFYSLLFILVPVASWAFIYPVFYINEPIESRVRNHFIHEAREIIQSSPTLVKIGITGSYGKTSTKNIIQAILSSRYYSLMTPASFNTPLGITRTIREDLKPIHEVFVCEMGADKVGDIDYLMDFIHPKFGVVTSIGPQHLNTFGSLENIIKEKMLMVEKLGADGVGIINVDNEYIRNYRIKNNCRIIRVGVKEEDADYRAVDITYHAFGTSFSVLYQGEKYSFETKLLGEHNVSNILLGIALGREMNIRFEDLQKAVASIEKIEHRLELKKINGFTFIDDAFNANPVGSAMSLDVLSRMPEKRWIVTPGMIDLGEKEEEVNYHFGQLMKGKADKVILVGPKQTEAIYRGLQDSGFDMNEVYVVEKVNEAFGLVYQNASQSDTILLENDLPDAFNN